MHKIKALAFLGLLLFGLSACRQASEPTPTLALTEQPVATMAVPQASPELESTEAEVAEDYCLDCHTSEQKLKDSLQQENVSEAASEAQPLLAAAIPMEPWEKVLVDGENFPNSIHGLNGCIDCHQGVQSPEMAVAHQGLIPNPSRDPQKTCGKCHLDIVAHAEHSLHFTTAGFFESVKTRGTVPNHPALEEAVSGSCASCHATCGDCHVSQPAAAGGGFVNGHEFARTPPMEDNCAICHSNTAGPEFMGKNQGVSADIHYTQGQMSCTSCHSKKQTHGMPSDCAACHPGPSNAVLKPDETRYDGVQAPRCESCHANIASGQDQPGNLYHQMHGAKLSCQVCHSVEYTNCQGCHVNQDNSFVLEGSSLGFLIGQNPQQSYERPYQYVPVRHIPVTTDTFAAFGSGLLDQFGQLETWTYATPHNIQRQTPQTKSCNACHGNPDIFLTADKVSPQELEANQDVIVSGPPERITEDTQFP